MTPYGLVSKYPEPEHHGLVVLVAILLSIAIHLAMMFYLRDYSFRSPGGIQERMSRLFHADSVEPMRVEPLPKDPLFATLPPANERITPPQGVEEVSHRVDRLSQSTPPALTAPPIPREALTPGVPQLSETVTAMPVDLTPWVPRQEIVQIFDRSVQDTLATIPRREIPLIERISHAPDVVPSIDLTGRQFGNEPEPPRPLASKKIAETPPPRLPYVTPAVTAPEEPPQISAAATEKKFAAGVKEKRGKVAAALTDEEKSVIQKEVEAETKKIASLRGEPSTEKGALHPLPSAGESAAERAAREAQQKISNLQETVSYEPIDDLLGVGMETYRDKKEPDRVYFRISIQPRTDRPVPIVPKDLIFLQDVSGSMGRRLSYCARAMSDALSTLNAGDRFNVVAFRDTFEHCFPSWAPATADNIETANTFIKGLRASGQTDVFGSLKALVKYPRDPRRPMIAYVITDGVPTFGEVKSAAIIGDFSQLNNGLMSVYMFGASPRANGYLIDMLTYCNRGSSTILQGDPWDIPKKMSASYQSVRNPVMGDVSVTFDSASHAEVYPRNTANLYKDSKLELYGSCPVGTVEVVCQIRGLAEAKGYDSILRLNLNKDARFGKSSIKVRWGIQKMYHLVGEYSRLPRPGTMVEMVELHNKYGIMIPYEAELR